MKLPHKHLAPSMMEEAILVVELGLTPDELDEIPESLLERICIYKGVKNVMINGGTYNP